MKKIMNVNDQKQLASKLLKITLNEVERNSAVIEKYHALYVAIPIKEGASIIVGDDGSVLYADSSIAYSMMLQEFEKGRRTPLEAFDM